ncbi:MAG: lysophospholipase [Rhodospirillaceae bacterium]|nr:MAG: lysophospholipase [Rhodospirillaceae bacterium]
MPLTPPPLPTEWLFAAEPSAQTQNVPHSSSVRAVGQEDRLIVLFPATVADVPEEAKSRLRHLAERIMQNADAKIQLMAYAGGEESEASKARRLSLDRALEVRSYLMEQQVPSNRIEVRAFGNRPRDGPPDRVDLVLSFR